MSADTRLNLLAADKGEAKVNKTSSPVKLRDAQFHPRRHYLRFQLAAALSGC